MSHNHFEFVWIVVVFLVVTVFHHFVVVVGVGTVDIFQKGSLDTVLIGFNLTSGSFSINMGESGTLI